jgi:hypothetical protein
LVWFRIFFYLPKVDTDQPGCEKEVKGKDKINKLKNPRTDIIRRLIDWHQNSINRKMRMIKMKKLTVFLVLALLIVSVTAAMASMLPYSIEWDGQGSDSLRCDKLGESPERTADGWIHWIVTSASGITEAELELGGSGSGIYSPSKYGPVVEFFTPYFDVDTLAATLHYAGTLDQTSQFVISDYCPGAKEELKVTKTAITSFTRKHLWDIAKKVETENGYEHEGFPKIWLYANGSGNEKATWTVDVIYKGYKDGDFKITGEITIENTGTLDAVILDVKDLIGTPEVNTDVTVVCGVEFPYTLPVGQTLTCTYTVKGYYEGKNQVKVITERDVYHAFAPIVWGDPSKEINKTVNVKDISDLFGEVALGTVTAPNGATFTYDKYFAWKDFGAKLCGDYVYNNTATIVETGQFASATLKVNVQCMTYETAYAKGGGAVCFIPTFSNWGWTNPVTKGEFVMDLWAAAGQCDTSKGILVGSVTVVYGADNRVTVTYDLDPGFTLEEKHVYAGYDMFPKDRRGNYTVAPGAYTNASPFDGSQVWVIAHAVVGIPDPNFGP